MIERITIREWARDLCVHVAVLWFRILLARKGKPHYDYDAVVESFLGANRALSFFRQISDQYFLWDLGVPFGEKLLIQIYLSILCVLCGECLQSAHLGGQSITIFPVPS